MVRERRQCCAARQWEEGRQAVSKIKRAVSMKITAEDSKRGNTAAMRERLKTVSQSRGIDETKSFSFYPVQESCMSGATPHM